MSDKKPAKGKDHHPAQKRHVAKPSNAVSAKPESAMSKSEHHTADHVTADHVDKRDHSHDAHLDSDLMNTSELSQPEMSEASQIPVPSEEADSSQSQSSADRKPVVKNRRVLDVFLIDSGWNNEVGKAVRDNLPIFASYLEGQRFFVLNETQSLAFIKRHPSLVGADPILIVLDRQAVKERNSKGFGFRLCLGHMRNPDGAISMMKWAIQLSMASNGTQMATIIKQSGHRQSLQGTIELIGEGSAHLLEFAPV